MTEALEETVFFMKKCNHCKFAKLLSEFEKGRRQCKKMQI